MTFSISAGALVDALKRANEFISGKVLYNVESNVLLSATDTELTVTATNNTVWMQKRIPLITADVSDGINTVALYNKALYNMLKSAKGTLHVSVDEYRQCNITAGDVHHTLVGIDPCDYPIFPSTPEAVATLPVSTLAHIYKHIVPFISTDTFKPSLRGVFFESKDAFACVATNGKMLAHAIYSSLSAEFTCIVEPSVLNCVRTLPTDSVFLHLDAERIGFSTDDTLYMASLIEGQFPQYRQVIPTKYAFTAEVSRVALQKAIKHIMPIIAELRSKRMFLTFSRDSVEVRGVSQELGETYVQIPCTSTGDVVRLACNYAYLQNILNQMGDVVRISANDDSSPIRLSSAQRHDPFAVAPQAQYILMPMKLEDE